ncbi:hypothetical protein A4X13_0g7775 [Tilletia indica]|uniref:Uncharacterized protein n=1 Tax=Tilletia indica TaxID=43049 RepID=A0A177T3F6_9BASI|nr:hypothetical protein A4X13_0g7775 [Tilletia indica]
MQEEYDSLVKKKTWEKVSRRKAKRLIRSRWVYKLKLDALGRAMRHKARLVAMGNTQRAGIDYGETFSPVARMSSLRMLLVLAAKFGWIVEQSDVVTAYLNGVLHDEVYMEQPPGFEDGTSDVLLLRKALYGLKQSGREWNEVLVKALIKAGFSQLESEPCIFVRNPNDWKRIVILAVYVDDILIFTPNREECEQVKRYLRDEFEIKENGPVHHFLGLQVTRDESAGTITLSQQAYANATLQRYGMDKANGRDLPMDETSKIKSPNSPISMGDYPARVGSLMWLAQCTRLDFLFSVGVLARKMASPDDESVDKCQHALRHLRKTSDLKLTYKPTGDIVLQGYADADHGMDREERKSTTGWVFLLYGCAVSWKSQLQKTTAWSTTEAEYMALFEAAREALWIRTFLGELGLPQTTATPLYCDNDAATTIANNRAAFGKSKHFDIKYHFTRQRVQRGELTVTRVDTDDNLADILTKVLPRGKQELARSRLGLSG